MSPASIRLPAARARQPRHTAEASAILTIDLGAIRANYRQLRDRLGGTACAGVVKADAYGLGAAEVARALLREGCRTFFVAQLEEGIALRDTVGASPDIYVLNGIFPGSAPACVDAG
ncbi:MAG: alanine racemase, partial [Rhizobiaceae bacterium]